MGLFGCSHRWTKWTKPFKRGPNKGMQQRHCRNCGRLKTREAKAPLFHFHKWYKAHREDPFFSCKVIGCKRVKLIGGKKK